jgi:hypothetical protein
LVKIPTIMYSTSMVELSVWTLRWLIFWKNKNAHKSILQCLIFNFFWYHGFDGNKVHVSKAINSTLIGAHLHIPNIYTSRKKKLKFEKKNNYAKDLWNYGSILIIQKSLIKIWLWFLREDFHTKVYYLMLNHILNHYR